MSSARSQAKITRAGLVRGLAMVMPALPGVIVFGLAFGAAAAARGLTLGEASLMSVLVYAGMAQMVALEAWPASWSWSTVASIALLTMVVNSRMVLMGAALHPWLSRYPHWVNASQLAVFTDANYLVAARYQEEGGDDLGVMIGAGLALWVIWLACTIPGHVLGALVPDPRPYALDLVMPIFFAAMLVPLWKGKKAALPWLVAGVAALLAAKLIGGHWFILIGALSGVFFAAAQSDD